jgi:ribosomal protein L22
MSAEEEKGSSEDVKDEAPAEDAAAKKPVAKKAAAKKPAAAEKPTASEKPTAVKKPAAEKKPPAVKKSPAAKEPVAIKESTQPEKRPARRAAKGGGQAPPRRIVRARARYVRTSARKARMVCGHIRGKSIVEARAILAFTPREVARDWSKLLESAVANAESNHELLEDDLIVREAYADEGPTIKRFRPRAKGSSSPIRKRTSHLTITLTPGS